MVKPKKLQTKILEHTVFIEHKMCGMRSYNQEDIKHKYCGNCHRFIGEESYTIRFERNK